ncbi:MAG: hypothetical protein R3C05_19480 [Pirellulaceae bacterium]
MTLGVASPTYCTIQHRHPDEYLSADQLIEFSLSRSALRIVDDSTSQAAGINGRSA